eukprot:4324354-Amphidinium_carterae.1
MRKAGAKGPSDSERVACLDMQVVASAKLIIETDSNYAIISTSVESVLELEWVTPFPSMNGEFAKDSV